MKYFASGFVALMLLFNVVPTLQAQQVPSSFAEPVIVKVENKDKAAFERRFKDYALTGGGFQGNTTIDNLPTTEIRARLQRVYGDPTMRLDDFIGNANVRPGNSIQFEYWFIVNDSIPMIVLDIDGPFSSGLVYAGAVNYIDLMPEIKRTLSRKLMSTRTMGEYQDIFYSPERQEWYNVAYKNGTYITDKITRPARFNTLRLN
jgi:hypothetical protein